MLTDPRIERMAQVLIGYSLGVKKGWSVAIFAGTGAMPLVQAAYREVVRVGGFPDVMLDVPGARHMLLTLGSDEQLLRGDPHRLALTRDSDAVLRIMSDENTRASNNVPPARQALLQKGLSPIGALSMQRITEGRPGCLTLFPTNAYAQDAEMSLSEFEDFVFHACLLDTDEDPVERWLALSREQQRIVDWLDCKKSIHIEAPGTDLRMSIVGRNFVNSDGTRNFPSGEIFTSPVESTVEGRISFTYPASYQGRSVQGVKLTFTGGVVTEATADSGLEFLTSMLDLDAGARKMGEFAIGTNTGVTRITRNTLFDEKIAGTFHCALGEAYPNAGGTNHSAIHWDMVTDMRQGRITVDGALMYENGKFVV